MQEHDFVRISYSGKIKESGQALDSNENAPVIIGANWVIKGIDEALREMHIGEKKSIEVPPAKAFGERNADFVKLVSESEFKRHGQTPVPGMTINADNLMGRILTVSGGRVRIDFNHPLAGKVLIYDVEIKHKLENMDEKIKAILEFYMRAKPENVKIKIHEKEVEIETPHLMNVLYKKKVSEDIIKFLGFERVKFSEIFEKIKE